jgi:WD40 repeat protein
VAAGSDDGTVIIWCYPGDGKQVFRRYGRSNFPLIVWNPFNRDVLASYNKAVSGKISTDSNVTMALKMLNYF